ncbi:hypothetical protein CEQ90_12925 [Lewinellaceae bacterium SD302]|nr:hypothetical protein CEQ90_12925 [Lewinellaceae bacterium SD302]
MGSLGAQNTDCGELSIENVQYLGDDAFSFDIRLENSLNPSDCYTGFEFDVSLPGILTISSSVAAGVELNSSVNGSTVEFVGASNDADIPNGLLGSVTFSQPDDGCVQTALTMSSSFTCNPLTICDGPSALPGPEICNTFLTVAGEVYSPVPGMGTAELPEFGIRTEIGGDKYDNSAVFNSVNTENEYINEGIPTTDAQDDGFTAGLIDPAETELTLPDVEDACGVNIVDIIATRRLFLGLEDLVGWQRVAADANQNDLISTQDIILMTRLILGIEPDPFDYSVRFPTPANLDDLDDLSMNTQDASYSGTRAWEPLGSSQADVDFAAVKLGDVTGDCFLLGASDDPMDEQDTTRLTSTIDFTISPVSGTTDQYETNFYAADFNANSILSMEFLLNAGFEVVSIADGAVEFSPDNHVLKSTNESLRFIHVDSTFSGTSTLIFSAIIEQTDPSADILQAINPAPANGYLGELYVGEDNGEADIRNLTLNRITTPPSTPSSSTTKGNATIFPNPANEVLSYRFDQPLAKNATLRVLSISGQQILEVIPEPNATFGSINIRSLPTGFFILTTEFEDGSIITHRFVKQ